MDSPLTLALSKGRLFDLTLDYLKKQGLELMFKDRKLSAMDVEGRIRAYVVKNRDLPIYLHHGITHLGIVGDDKVTESGFLFTRVLDMPFGDTKLCLSSPQDGPLPKGAAVSVATSYVRTTREWFHRRGLPVRIIKLDGSVELAPALGLAPYIVDLVETGGTLKAHGLKILAEIAPIKVRLLANPAAFKLHHRTIAELVDILTKGSM